MLSGWYCRSLATTEQTEGQQMDSGSAGSDDEQEHDQNTDGGTAANANTAVDYRGQYKLLKRKLKYLIYENEFFQDALRSNQRRLVKVTRDRAFLLDRLMQYEKPENTSSESDTESSEDEITKKRKLDQEAGGSGAAAAPVVTGLTRGRKKKVQSAASTSAAVAVEKAPNELQHAMLDQSASMPSRVVEEEAAASTSIEQPFNSCAPAEYNN